MTVVSDSWLRVPLDERVVQSASAAIARHALRSLDPLQLASALVLREQPSFFGDILLFIASDVRLLNAARAEGLAVWNPKTASSPEDPAPVN